MARNASAHYYYVGRNTKFYGLPVPSSKEDFGELPKRASRRVPLSYDDLEPYYTQPKNLYQVHGIVEKSTNLRPTPHIPGRPSAMNRASSNCPTTSRVGLKPFHVPVGVMLDEKNPHKSRCIRCQHLRRVACLLGAKSDAQVVCVDEALKHSNVTMLTTRCEAPGNICIGPRV